MERAAFLLDQAVAAGVVLFVAGVVGFSIRRYRTADPSAAAGGSLVLGPRIRSWYVDHLAPFEDACVRSGVTPAALSYTQLVGSIVVGALYAAGLTFTAGWVLLATSSLDIVDGRVARRTGGASPRGAFLDSVIDRYAESFAYCGLAIYFRATWMLAVVLFALTGSLMVSYARARAEGLGAENRVGVLQRPERLVILGFGTIFGALYAHLVAPWTPGPADLLTAATVLLIAVLANITAVQRVLYTYRELAGEAHIRPPIPLPTAPAEPGLPMAQATAARAATQRRVVGTFTLMIGAGLVLDLHAVAAGSAVIVCGAVCLASGLYWPGGQRAAATSETEFTSTVRSDR
ncbi:CDP-alcohol phosphatidyltransferase family protein [Candidatus Binatia bacterium]|nr:CDP-alcohol phosphatidyltransferase family protein [Candidatus Binatia bacterium]